MLAGMGTELQCSPNFFTTLPRSHGGTVTISFDASDTRASSKDRPLKNRTGTGGSASDPLPQPMERIQRHKESLRQTMLEHEQIFKEQVRELHRLYRTQKLLMSQLQGRDPKLHLLAYPPLGATAQPSTGIRSSASSGAPPASSSPSTSNRQHHHRHSDQHNSTSEHSSHLGHRSKASLGSQELAICSPEHPRAAAHSGDGVDHRQPPAEGAPASYHKLSTETPSSCSDEECDLDLTLTIGCGGSNEPTGRRSHSEAPSGRFCPGTSTAQSTGHLRTSTSSTTPARSDPGGRGDPSGPMAVLDREREGLQRPAWLFQGLSLNRT
ncbi:hypothetical protein Taro_049159 [Colocasia esculenta]|uniref:Uncharacterized protein n=1 Tax=Colocasia esculenta TaxID=4460 RepID=A0A843XA92_COLES|nr:hypothetical protein [Colocasia esculenta]